MFLDDHLHPNEISTHAPLARCDPVEKPVDKVVEISTHAPLARCDHHVRDFRDLVNPFQLTHLLRGATWTKFPAELVEDNFNSRTSCEVRRNYQKT